MAEPEPEGWDVPDVRPAAVAVGVLAMLVAVLTVAGLVYRQRLEPRRQQPVTIFPAPGIETFIHDGARDPHRPLAMHQPAGDVEAAKRAVVASGIPGWEPQR